ncbi:Bug family tripartite tricarboxylate transporter substrate binding protein [uncultured Enterovirga sp.]|uniref:Bug family tripartite tricarboxylate transporter substrate binding protein n=1 Tax=uncultured Enterovirga sp. TaxID=2026352 RepID=UPI0035CA135B
MRRRSVLGGLALAALGARYARAQDAWPTRPVRFIMPTVPGGGTDNLARLLQQHLAARLGQPVIIENRPGGAYIPGTEAVVRATDGHTIGMIVVNTHAANATVQKKLPYDTLKDIAPIVNLTSSPNIIAVHPSMPVKTLVELIAMAKEKPGSLFYATSGIAGGQHFAGEMLKKQAGVDIVHVPYRGSGASLTDAVAGQVKLIFANVISAQPHLSAGKLRPLAVTSAERSPMFPDVPTVAEQGFPGFDISDSYGVIGPAAMPAPVVTKIYEAFRDAMLSPDLTPKLRLQGVFPRIMDPAEFKTFIGSEVATLRQVAIEGDIKGEQ